MTPEARFFSLPKHGRLKVCLVILLFHFIATPLAFAGSCTTQRFDSTGYVKQVFDGDTLQLRRGEKIRMLGINTPEMNYDKGRPEPLALRAKRLLSKMVLHKKIKLRYGAQRKDRYHRSLAHVFLPDGTNVQASLLQKGLAFNIAIPPNLWLQDCYQSLEQRARKSGTGIWSHPAYRPLPASKVSRRTLGFQRVRGKIQRVGKSRNAIWLNLTSNMALRINKKDKQYFPNLSKNYWQGKTVIAKGWITDYKNRFTMYLRHPANIIVVGN